MKTDSPTFYHLFRNICTDFSNNECVIFISELNTRTVSYMEMEYMIEEISNYCKEIIVRPNQYVGILYNNLNPEVIAMMMGISKIHASFVFVDPSLNNILDVARRLNIKYFIGEETRLQDYMEILNITVANDLSRSKFFKSYRLLVRSVSSTEFCVAEDTAFAAFSSGSTGHPKIIQIPHRCILPNIWDLKSIYELQPSDTIYILTPPTFDPCILDVVLALSTGCRILIMDNNLKFNGNSISKIFSDLATVLYITPSLFVNIFPKCIENSSLKILTFGGEPFPTLDPTIYMCLRNTKVYNIYGITEVSCWASINLVTESGDASIGKPLSNTIFEVRDQDGNVVNDGLGELFIGSSERICTLEEDHSHIVKPCFRSSGDIVQIQNEKYCYIGRTDRRVKVFGHQVHLPTIDAKLSSFPSVKYSYSIFIEEESRIIILVVPHSNDVSVENVEIFLKSQKLPSYMIPNQIFLISEIPLNYHGKICEKACKELYFTLKSNVKKEFTSEFNILWRRYTTLKQETPIKEDLGFIACGGDSFTALQFTTSLADICQVPNDFIVSLLSNTNYIRCLQLITQTNTEFITPSLNNDSHIEDKIVNEVESEVNGTLDIPKPKRNRLNFSFGCLNQVRCRGETKFIINYNTPYEFPKDKSTPGNLEIIWKHNTTKCVDASPTVLVYDKKLIAVCGSHSGQILFVDIECGDVMTKILLPDRVESSACVSTCGKFIYLGCYNHNLYCIDVEEAMIKWSFKTGDMVKSTAVYFDKKLYFGSYDHYFYCVSEDGHLLYKTNIDDSSIFATAVVQTNGIVITTTGGTIAFLKDDGTVKHKVCFKKPFFASPCQIRHNLCLTIDVTGAMRLFNTVSGDELWHHKINGNVFSSASHINTSNPNNSQKIVFGCHDKRVYCFEISENEATLCWYTIVDAPVYATPFYYQQPSGIFLVAVASTSGNIYVMSAVDGTILKSRSINSDIFSSPVVIGSTMIVGCRDNNLYGFSIS